MRVVLVGTPEERRVLRRSLNGTALEIAGEASTIAAARSAGLAADAFLVSPVDRAERAHHARDVALAGLPIAPEVLTAREIEVLELVAEGLANKAIASRLGISDQTVKFHVASISGKLGAANRTDAVRRALHRGLITL